MMDSSNRAVAAVRMPDRAASVFRQATRADIDEIARLWNEAIVRGESTHAPEPLTTDQVSRYLFDVPPKFEIYAHEVSNRLIGWGGLMRYHERKAYGNTAEIVAYVSANHRRRGVGRSIVNHALQRAHALRFHAVVLILQAAPSYLTASALRLGFRYTGHLSHVLPIGGDWRDIYIFEKLLSG